METDESGDARSVTEERNEFFFHPDLEHRGHFKDEYLKAIGREAELKTLLKDERKKNEKRQSTIETLEAKIKLLLTENNSLKDHVQQLNEVKEADSLAFKMQLSETYAEVNEKEANWKQKIAAKELELHKMKENWKTEKENLHELIQQLEDRNRHVNERLTYFTCQLKEQQVRFEHEKSQHIASMEAVKYKLSKEVEHVKESQKKDVATLTSELKDALGKAMSLSAKNFASEQKIKVMSDKVSTLLKTKEDAAKKIQHFKEINGRLSVDVRSSEMINVNEQQRLKSLLVEKDRLLKELTIKNRQLRSNLSSCQEQASQLQTQLKLQTFKSGVELKRSKIQTQQVLTSMTSQEHLLKECDGKRKMLLQEVRFLRQENQRITDKNNALARTVTDLKDEMMSVANEKAEAIRKFKDKLLRNKNMLKNTYAEKQLLEEELERLQEEARNDQIVSNNLKQNFKREMQTLENMNSKLTKKNTELEQLLRTEAIKTEQLKSHHSKVQSEYTKKLAAVYKCSEEKSSTVTDIIKKLSALLLEFRKVKDGVPHDIHKQLHLKLDDMYKRCALYRNILNTNFSSDAESVHLFPKVSLFHSVASGGVITPDTNGETNSSGQPEMDTETGTSHTPADDCEESDKLFGDTLLKQVWESTRAGNPESPGSAAFIMVSGSDMTYDGISSHPMYEKVIDAITKDYLHDLQFCGEMSGGASIVKNQ